MTTTTGEKLLTRFEHHCCSRTKVRMRGGGGGRERARRREGKKSSILHVFKAQKRPCQTANSDNSNITYINTQYRQIMANIAYRILKFESMIKKPIMANHVSFMHQFLRLYQFFRNTVFIRYYFQKDCHQDNLSFVCFQFYKQNCLNILEGNICFLIQAKSQ